MCGRPYISVVSISWVDCGAAGRLAEGVDEDADVDEDPSEAVDEVVDEVIGATHLVQIVETVVIVTVEIVDEVWVVVCAPDVIVAVTGQTVVVS